MIPNVGDLPDNLSALSVPSVSSHMASACSTIGGVRSLLVKMAGRTCQLEYWPSVSTEPLSAIKGKALWEGVALNWHLSNAGAQALCAPVVGHIPISEIDPKLLIAIVQDAVHDAITSTFPGVEVAELSFDALHDSTADATIEFVLAPLIDQEESIHGWISVPPESLDKLLGRCRGAFSDRFLLRRWGELPITVTAELGWVKLPLTELASIVAGDVIIADAMWRAGEVARACMRISPSLGLVIEIATDGQATVLTEVSRMSEIQLETEERAHPTRDAELANGLAELPVLLTFDLGQRQLSLRELNAIKAGHVFDLAVHTQWTVSIRANGRLVGEGRLVEVDGRPGVVVTRFSQS